MLQAADVDAKGEISYVAADVIQQDQEQSGEATLSSNNDESLAETGVQSDNQSERILQVINQSLTDTQETDQSAMPSGKCSSIMSNILNDGKFSSQKSFRIIFSYSISKKNLSYCDI